ncbi:MAG: hypothetical protein MI717_03350 [Spirochaetales bacterium]|nr:hypothetical protein [Spirochaetales bacterium]
MLPWSGWAMDVRGFARLQNSETVLTCVATGVDEMSLQSYLHQGATLRGVWSFRYQGQEHMVVRLVRRDSLSEGYLVYWGKQKSPERLISREDLSQYLLTLSDLSWPFDAPWNGSGEVSFRLRLDVMQGWPAAPLLNPGAQDVVKSPWRDIIHPGGGE